jgi:hypothetical protein
LLLDLLAHAASGSAKGASARLLERADDRQMQWVIDAGLAPLLYRASREEIRQVPAAWRDKLLSAELTAIVRHGNLIDAAREIVEACDARGLRVALLKGISVSDQFYPAAHLRPMGDIDILAPPSASATVESTILQLGYRPDPDHQRREGAHHDAPLFHPGRHVWVEVHNALFSENTVLRSGRLFDPLHVAARCVGSTFHGRTVDRLADELQLVYIASSWVLDLSRYGIHPSFVAPLLDALYLLEGTRRTLDWDELFARLDNPMAAASLYVMLTYLSRHGLCRVDPPILSRLAASQNVIDSSVLRAVHMILDKYLVRGRPFPRLLSGWHMSIVLSTLLAPGSSGAKLAAVPWNLAFPPSIAERYSLRYQLRRIAKALQGKA